jgi:uncharacterized membrane protein YphA (DoxX/SURF4 family)
LTFFPVGKDPSLFHGLINNKTRTLSILFPGPKFIAGNFFAAQTVFVSASRHLDDLRDHDGEHNIMYIRNIWRWFAHPPLDAPAATILLRLMAGSVFFWEGILKFVYTNQGVGRFTKLAMPFPEFTANFVGVIEIVGGLLLILGLFTRFIAFTFIIEMIVAILSTKISLYLGTYPLPLPPAPPQIGFLGVSARDTLRLGANSDLGFSADRRFGQVVP